MRLFIILYYCEFRIFVQVVLPLFPIYKAMYAVNGNDFDNNVVQSSHTVLLINNSYINNITVGNSLT